MTTIAEFIARWKTSSAAERSNFQLFMSELCTVLDLPQPQPATQNEDDNAYVFERNVRFHHGDGSQSIGRIDLYKRGCFVLEGKQSRKRDQDDRARAAKQLGFELGEASTRTGSGNREGRGWDAIMAGAKQQAESYAKALPTAEGWPPFIIVVDVGHMIEIYADFSLQGKHYAQFPDRQGYRISLDDLAKPEIQARLRAIWSDPLSLDPAKRTAEVTRAIAELLALLSKSLEKRGHNPGSVAGFLMRCLFSMFAEDVGLLPGKAFLSLLEQNVGKADQLHLALPHLWKEMDAGDFSPTLGEKILKFNGGLFRDTTAIPLDEQDLNWLILAAKCEWQDVEPAIFGTLLERALNKSERHKLGAHYTPRAYVERLVVPTIIEPLTEDWRAVQTEAADFLKRGDKNKARATVRAFHEKLCGTRVLDPACGTGNFLYVSLELMKRLEGEVLDMLADLGEDQYLLEMDRHTVDPHQFLGLEINPRAVAIAELVLWIGYLQWHFRTRGKVMPAEPVLKAFANIREQDAVLAYDKQEILRDKTGHPLTRWDGVTKTLHPITGEEIPDPDAQIELYKYVNPRPAKWPAADFVVGNPPFIGNKKMITALGTGYVGALRKSQMDMPETADFVMYWWAKAALLTQNNKLRRFGFVTTNSITMTFNRSIVDHFLIGRPPISLRFAIPDHPWSLEVHSAAVRIAMTVADQGKNEGILQECLSRKPNTPGSDQLCTPQIGRINSMLRIGSDLTTAKPLRANADISYMGIIPVGLGFVLTPAEMAAYGINQNQLPTVVKAYLSGRDLAQQSRARFIIDFFGLSLNDAERDYPRLVQRVIETVKPLRDAAARKNHHDNWWIFGEARPGMRRALAGLKHYIATTETAKHRWFVFMSEEILPDQKIRVIASQDAFLLAVLSSHIHTSWAIAIGGRVGKGNDPVYNTTTCFDPFPFPAATVEQKARIRTLGERLDSFRKERLAEHKSLTMTRMYNVLEKLRSGKALDDKDKDIHEMGLISVLKQIHDELDEAVAEAYGWPNDLTDEQILENLVALNKERAAEEREGKVRWLRPEFQAPKEVRKDRQIEAELVETESKVAKPNFPKAPGEQVAEVRRMLAAEGKPIKAGELARKFKQGKRVEDRVSELLQIMAAIGQAQTENGSRFFAAR